MVPGLILWLLGVPLVVVVLLFIFRSRFAYFYWSFMNL